MGSSPWMSALLLLGGDVEMGPGPTRTTYTQTYICSICNHKINKNQPSIKCNYTKHNHWIHPKCTNITLKTYNTQFICTQHTKTQTPPTSQSQTPTPTHKKRSPKPKKSPPKYNCAACKKEINKRHKKS